MHSYAGVAQHGLRTGGRDRKRQAPEGSCVIAAAPFSAARCAAPHAASSSGYRILPEPSLALFALGLLVGERSEATRTPVDDVLTPVDQTLLVQAHEHLTHRPAEARIQRECGAFPVAGGADRLELLEDGVAPSRARTPTPVLRTHRVPSRHGSCPPRPAGAPPRSVSRSLRGRCRVAIPRHAPACAATE